MAKRLFSLFSQSSIHSSAINDPFPCSAVILRKFSISPFKQNSENENQTKGGKIGLDDGKSENLHKTPTRGSFTSGRLSNHQMTLKRRLYHSVFLRLLSKSKKMNHPAMTKTLSATEECEFFLTRRLKKIQLPTHYLEVNYKTMKAVVYADPDMERLPPKIKRAVEQL